MVAYSYGYPAPVCAYGYYGYYPYACAPYGYYGPSWFAAASLSEPDRGTVAATATVMATAACTVIVAATATDGLVMLDVQSPTVARIAVVRRLEVVTQLVVASTAT